MGIGSCGGGKVFKLPAVLVYLVLSSMAVLLVAACGGEEAATTAAPVQPVAPAPVIQQPLPTLPPLQPMTPNTEAPQGADSAPQPTRVVVAPSSFGSSRDNTRGSAIAVPEPTPEPEPTAPPPTAMPEPMPTATPEPEPTATPAPVLNPVVMFSPNSAQPGASVSIQGSDFEPGATVSSVSFGGSSASPSTATTVGSDGSFTANVVVPDAAPGTYQVNVQAGSARGTATFTVQAVSQGPTVPAGSQIVSTLAPLGANLKWVAYFDNTSKSWSLYDPSGTYESGVLPGFQGPPADASGFSPLTEILADHAYYFFVGADAIHQIGDKVYDLKQGLNAVGW